MAYNRIFVLGDSLVDAGNALKLAQWYGGLPFTDLPDGAPYASDGYFLGRFSDGYTFADLLSNKAVGSVTKPTFPYHFYDPYLGLPIDPFASDPQGIALNFSYGGAQIIQGGEIVPDLDGQSDALKDAVDRHIDPGALLIVTIGGNDVRSLAPGGGEPTPQAEAYAALDAAAAKLQGELSGLIGRGAHDILITGIPDVGLIPRYDDNGNGILDGAEIARAAAATDYSAYLDTLIRTVVIPALEALGANVTYVAIADYTDALGQAQTGALEAIMPALAALHGLTAEELRGNLLEHQQIIFFDQVHPTGQVHGLIADYMQSHLTGAPWVETLPMAAIDVDFHAAGSIAVAGEVDVISIALAAGTTYRFDMLGISSLGTFGALGDPLLRILSPNNVLLGFNDDDGAGLDASLTFTAVTAGSYAIELTAVGSVTGYYSFEAAIVSGAALTTGNTYVVSSAATLVIEARGGIGIDTVQTSVSYALTAASEIEALQTTDARGRSAINLAGNEFGQTIIGNAGDNILDGRGGADVYVGGAGSDTFVLSAPETGIDRITDFGRGDTVDVRSLLSVASGVDVNAAGYLRVTSTGEIQIDHDGGANGWTTVGTVNSSSSYSFLYLSGGALARVDVASSGGGSKGGGRNKLNQVANDTFLMGIAVAAAGFSTTVTAETYWTSAAPITSSRSSNGSQQWTGQATQWSTDDINSTDSLSFSSFALTETGARGPSWTPTQVLDPSLPPDIGLPALTALLDNSEIPSWSVPQFNALDGMEVGTPSADALDAIRIEQLVDCGSSLDALVDAALPARPPEAAAFANAGPIELMPQIIFLLEPNFADGSAIQADAVQML